MAKKPKTPKAKPEVAPEDKKLNVRQLKFVDEFFISMNGTKAAKAAGYSEKTAAVIACELLKKPNIKAELKRRWDASIMTSEGAASILSTIAKSDLKDYMIVKKVVRRDTIEVPLSRLLAEKQAEYDFEEDFAQRVGWYDKVDEEGGNFDLKRHNSNQRERWEAIIRMKMELEINPNATRFVSGPEHWSEEMDLDLVALARDKERGKVKKIKFGEFGPEVEMYPADSNAAKILEFHGKMIAKGELELNGSITFDVGGMVANFMGQGDAGNK